MRAPIIPTGTYKSASIVRGLGSSPGRTHDQAVGTRKGEMDGSKGKISVTDKAMLQTAMTGALEEVPFILFSPDTLDKYEQRKAKVIREYGFLPRRQPTILDGSILPQRFEPVPPYFYNKPIEELENGIYEKTFCVLSLRFHKNFVHRFSATNSVFIFSPWNSIRKACVALVTNQYFDYMMILTILVNCVFLALSNPIEQAEYAFLSIYTTEMLIKSIAKGFVLNKYTYLRNPWNWLDFVVIVLGYVTIFVDLGRFSGLRTFRVFRALKTVSILPGLKTIVNALLHSVKMLAEVMMLTVFCIMVFALFALQIYMGQLRNKCILTPDSWNFTADEYYNYTHDENNWKMTDDKPVVCGNSSGALPCPANYSCLADIADNPNFGYTSFDNFGAAMLTTFQLITLDFWEDVYNNVIYSCGPFNVIFFVFVVFFGSFYLVNLMLAVVAMSYEEEVEATQSESKAELSFEDAETQLTPKKPKKKRIITRRGAITLTDPVSDTETPDLPARPTTQAQRPMTQAQRPMTQAQQLQMTPLRTPLKTEGTEMAEDRYRFVAGNRTTTSQSEPAGVPFSRYNQNDNNRRNAVNNRKSRQQRPAPARAVVQARSIILCECGMEGCDQSIAPCTYGVGIPCINDTPPASQGRNSTGVGAPAPQQPQLLQPSQPPPHPTNQVDESVGTQENNDNNAVNMPAPGFISRDSAISTGTNTYQRALSELYKSAPDTLYDEPKQTQVLVLDDNLPDRNCACCSRCCCRFTLWLRLQKLTNSIVSDPLVELFITGCIIINTVFLAIEHHGMSRSLKEVLSVGNKVFTTIFTIETTLKLISLSKEYFKISWNVFDLIIVVFSLIELGLEGINGLSVLRALRLLRVFKLAQSWTTMRVLLSIIVSTLGALGNLTLVLVIIMYIFAVLGMQLFGNNYTADKFGGELPRWHFQDFVHSFMMIFRVLCGEWIEPLWDCMKVSGETCMAIFLPALVVGNFVVLNLFLALLLSSFNSEELSKNNKKDEEVSRLAKGMKRLRNILCCCCMFIYNRRKRKLQRQVSEETEAEDTQDIVMKSEIVMAYTNTVYEDDESQPVNINHRKTISMPHNLNIPNHMNDNTLEVPRPVTVATMEDINLKPPVRERPMARRISWTPVVDYVDSLRHGSMESLEISDTLLQVKAPMESNNGVKIDASTQTTDHGGSMKGGLPQAKDAREETAARANGNANIDNQANHKLPPKQQQPTINSQALKSTQAIDDTEPPSADAFLQSALAIVDDPDDVIPLEQRNPEDCFPEWFYKKCCCCKAMLTSRLAEVWFQFRKRVIRIVDHWIFEWAILVLIFASSVTLCFEDVNLESNPTLKISLYYLNIIFCVIYAAEMLLKWLAHGFVVYFRNGWSILDFVIVVASIFSVVVDGNKNLVALRSVRTLRALRPLRAISRWQGMKIVVNALMSAIPSIFNVLLVCIVFWLIFSIMGVQFFAGRFYQCLDENKNRPNISIVNNRTQCDNLNYSWVNEPVNFDNVGQGYLALFQVATFEGWIEVMQAAVDARGIDLQPQAEANLTAYFYFIVFIVCGSFFTLNLFIGVIIDNFNMLKKKYEGGVMNIFLTESQKKYYAAMKKLGRKKPQKLIRRPRNKCQAVFYDLSMSRRFEMVVFVVIMSNMICMAIDHYKQSDQFNFIVETMNIVFTSLFTVEASIKIIGLRQYYFTVPWNVFDFVLVISSILGIVLKDILTSSNFFVSPTLLRVVRVFRIGRILRLIKAAKGIRKLLFALVVSLPALFNIGALIFLIMFIYSIIGMSLFSHIKHTGVLNEATNFETFGRSMLLLFRLLTSAGWNDILEPLMVQPPDCEPNYGKHPNGNCGSSSFAIVFLVSYVIINFMIIINMYIAVILENFNQAHQEEELGIVEDDLEMFYINWAKYDPHAAQFISFWELSDFVDTLDPPLRIPKPNQIALVSFNLPIAKGMKIHCLDILHALVKHVLGHVEETEDFQKLRNQMEEKFKKQFPTRKQLELVTTTLQWKRYNFAARIVQQAYRNHKFKRLRREQGSSQLLGQSANHRPSSKFGRGLRTLSQFLSLPKALPGSPSRRSAKSRPPSSAKANSSTAPSDIFFFQPKT